MLIALANLKTRLGITNASEDTPLTDLIKGVSNRAADFCDRILEREAAAVEYHDSQRVIALKHYPVESLSLSYDTSRDFASDSLLVANDYYVLDEKTGLVRLLFEPVPYPLAIKAVVTGGYVSAGTAPGAGQTAIPDAITRAMMQQCEFEWKNHPEFGRSNVSMQGQNISVAEFDLLREVKATLQSYKRISF